MKRVILVLRQKRDSLGRKRTRKGENLWEVWFTYRADENQGGGVYGTLGGFMQYAKEDPVIGLAILQEDRQEDLLL